MTPSPSPPGLAERARPGGASSELGLGALAAGAAIGVLLAIANVSMGLATGFWETGTVSASVASAALLSRGRGGNGRGRLAANAAQCLATAAGGIPAAAGLIGAVPALALLGRAPPAWAIASLGLALGVLSVGLAHALRRRLLEEEGLSFPSGTAAGEVIAAANAGGAVRTLSATAALSAAAAWLRDGVPRLVPAVLAPPGAPAIALAASPLLAGAGVLIGIAGAGAIALGAVVAWGVLPALGWARGASLRELAVWPGVGLVLGGAVVALGADLRSLARAAGDLAAVRSGRGPIALVVAGGVATVVVARAGFGLPLPLALGAVGIALVLASACARSAGLTDVAPAGELGQLAQAATGPAAAGAAGATVVAGAVSAGAATQTAVALWSLRAGSVLRADPARERTAQLAGVLVGAVVAVPVYTLLTAAHPPGSAALPAPSAARWRALALVLAGRGAALPPGAVLAGSVGLAAGIALALASRTRAGRFLPHPSALGVGFLIPAPFSATMLAGAALARALRGRAPRVAQHHLAPAAAGAIAGESLATLAAAALAAAGLLPR